jgi:3'-phosphoadenosine 5'-phosphosulfate sulfotransferase (PAPS reductase)/FAD synthetase
MSKTTRRFGWDGGRGEISAMRRPENVERGNPPRYSPGDLDGDPAYEADHPWTDAEFLENARVVTAMLTELDRLETLKHRPVAEWSDADVERIAAVLRAGRW